MIIDVTFFTPPNAKKSIRKMKISGVDEKYKQIANAGCIITIEYLRMTKELSICIEEPDIGDYDCEIVSASKKIGPSVEKLISRFDIDHFNKWCEIEGRDIFL